MTHIEIITSAYNEELCLEELFERFNKVFAAEPNYKFSVIIFDNGSSDRTWEIICKIASRYGYVRGFRMSRNFSLDAALTAGIDMATADAAIIMASDLQDPPEVIPKLLRDFEQGIDQVFVKVTKRQQVPFLRRKLSGVFYKSAAKLTDGMLPEYVSDFRLMSRNSYLAVQKMRESHRFLRGLSAWVGFKTSQVEIERPPRHAGESTWLKSSLLRVISHGIRSIFAFSSSPLIWVSTLGLILSGISVAGVCVLSITWITGTVPFAGFGTIVGLISLGFSLTIFCVGIVGQYIALIYDEVKARPLYLISDATSG